MSPGRNHERIAATIGILIEAYCDKFVLDCFPFGSTRIEAKGLEGKEPDTSYAFKTDKDKPDLAVEVIFSGENPRRHKTQGNAHQDSGSLKKFGSGRTTK